MLILYEDSWVVLELHVSPTMTEEEVAELITRAKQHIAVPKAEGPNVTLRRGARKDVPKGIPADVVEYENAGHILYDLARTMSRAPRPAWLIAQQIENNPQVAAVMSRMRIIS